jgi:hypothetical protein
MDWLRHFGPPTYLVLTVLHLRSTWAFAGSTLGSYGIYEPLLEA